MNRQNSLSRTMAAAGLVAAALITGCASPESARITFSYVVEPERGLPQGMETLAIMPAKIGPTTEPKWSDMCATVVQSLVEESRSRFGTPIRVTDRRDTHITFDEADLSAAGMSTRAGGSGGQLLAADGVILSNINVKVEKHVGKQRTLAGLSLGGGGGRGYGHGGTDIRTEEVETVTRNMTVQTEFKLLDTANNRVWEHYSPRVYQSTDRTKSSPIFGSSSTEADLTPQDQIVATLVERAAREFIARLMTCRVDVDAYVVAGKDERSAQGVRLLRADAYEEALTYFKSAVTDNPNDHDSAYGAGVALEALGRYEEALGMYRQALMGQDNTEYREAADRVRIFGPRAKRGSRS